jgi:hypothetical protein
MIIMKRILAPLDGSFAGKTGFNQTTNDLTPNRQVPKNSPWPGNPGISPKYRFPAAAMPALRD